MSRAATDRLKVSPALGKPPVLEWIAPAELLVDESYQRTLENKTSETLIRKIAMHWDWGLCQPINVARRVDGSLWIIDGQHRRAAAMLREDIPHLPCVVLAYPNAGDEATAFVALNKQRRPLVAVDVFKAALAAGDAQAQALVNAMAEAGLSVAAHGNYIAWKPGQVYCIPTIAQGVKQHGMAVTKAAMVCLAEAYPNQILQYAGQLIEGLLEFLALHGRSPDFKRGDFIEKLRTHSQSGWVNQALRVRGHNDVNRKVAMRMAFEKVWGGVSSSPLPMAEASRTPTLDAMDERDGSPWCDQCDRRVSAEFARACQSRFCSLRKVA